MTKEETINQITNEINIAYERAKVILDEEIDEFEMQRMGKLEQTLYIYFNKTPNNKNYDYQFSLDQNQKDYFFIMPSMMTSKESAFRALELRRQGEIYVRTRLNVFYNPYYDKRMLEFGPYLKDIESIHAQYQSIPKLKIYKTERIKIFFSSLIRRILAKFK